MSGRTSPLQFALLHSLRHSLPNVAWHACEAPSWRVLPCCPLVCFSERYRQRVTVAIWYIWDLVMPAVGFIGSHFFQVQQDAVLKPGQEMNVAGYKLVYFCNIDRTYPDVEILTAQLQVWHDGQLQQLISHPGRQLYTSFADQPTSLISITTYILQIYMDFSCRLEWAFPRLPFASL